MSQTLSLFRLQKIDIQIDHIQTRLKIIQNNLDDDADLRHLSEEVKAAEVTIQSAEQLLKQAERDVQVQQIKIEQTQSSLYGAKSHSPKELLDLQNDLASLKRHLVILEDHQIEVMQVSETAEADLISTQAKLRTAQTDRGGQNEGLLKEQEALGKDLERLSIERNAVAGAIPREELDLYDNLRQQRRGIAVAIISDSSCGACGSNLSLAQMQSARSSGEVALCPSCGRILYGS